MKVQSGQCSASDEFGRGFPAKCYCGLPSVVYTSATPENPGRPFFRCPTMKKKHLFKWVKDGVYEEVVDALPRIGDVESQMGFTKSELEELQIVVRDLKEEVRIRNVESKEFKKMTILCFGFLCLIIIVIVVMIICGGTKDVENPGRPFFRCSTMKKKHLFKWVEDGVYEEVVDALLRIGDVESQMGFTKSELEELQIVVRDLKEEVRIRNVESKEFKKMTILCFGFLCLIIIVIVVMIICGGTKDVEMKNVV